MPKFSHTAEIGTLHTSGDHSVAPGCACHGKNSYSSALQYWLILLGRNVVKVMGSNPARVIVIEVVVMSKQHVHKTNFRWTHTCI
jgi:hypothetical protein